MFQQIFIQYLDFLQTSKYIEWEKVVKWGYFLLLGNPCHPNAPKVLYQENAALKYKLLKCYI